MSELSAADKEACKLEFDSYDLNKDGMITLDEVEQVLEIQMGRQATPQEIQSFFATMGVNDFKITWERFVKAWIKINKQKVAVTVISPRSAKKKIGLGNAIFDLKLADVAPPDEEAYIQTLFKVLDKEEQGFLTADRVHFMLSKFAGASVSPVVLESVMSIVSPSKDGIVSFTQFSAYLKNEFVKMRKPSINSWEDLTPEEQDYVCVQQFDTDKNGYIDDKELRVEMERSYGGKITKEQVYAMMQNMDINGDGKVSLEEYKKHMVNVIRLTLEQQQ